jgi:hypothetical protein
MNWIRQFSPENRMKTSNHGRHHCLLQELLQVETVCHLKLMHKQIMTIDRNLHLPKIIPKSLTDDPGFHRSQLMIDPMPANPVHIHLQDPIIADPVRQHQRLLQYPLTPDLSRWIRSGPVRPVVFQLVKLINRNLQRKI